MRGQGESSALPERFPDRHAAARLSQTRIFPEPRRRIDCHGLRPRNDRTQFLRHVDTWEPPCGYTNDHCAVTLHGFHMTMLRCLCAAMSGIFCTTTLSVIARLPPKQSTASFYRCIRHLVTGKRLCIQSGIKFMNVTHFPFPNDTGCFTFLNSQYETLCFFCRRFLNSAFAPRLRSVQPPCLFNFFFRRKPRHALPCGHRLLHEHGRGLARTRPRKRLRRTI